VDRQQGATSHLDCWVFFVRGGNIVLQTQTHLLVGGEEMFVEIWGAVMKALV
jgi:hypothetical protein